LHADVHSDQPEVFISYASKDRALAAILHGRLVAAGFSVWFDRARLNPGCDWHKEIEAGCEAAHVILPLLTPNWQHSPWTKYEAYASSAVIPLLARGKPEAVMPPPLRRWNAYSLNPRTADAAAWQTLFAAIRAKLAEPVPERAPRIVDLPYPANPFFTGCDADLVRIHEELHEAPVAALTQGRARALAAMGGVGKTTLANEYARRFWRLYPQILWVDARAGLESGFALLFEKLFPKRAGEDLKQPDKAKLALAELCGKQDRLLVIDNVEDAKSVVPWLPDEATTGCRTLITSRFSDFPATAGIRSIPLDVLEPQPSRGFLLARTGRTAEGTELVACDELAKALGYLPLALEQAAAYIAAPGVGFAGYLRLYEAAAADLLARKALGSTKYPDAVIATWQTTVGKLSPESRAVLRRCAWYADTPIPRALVMEGAAEILALAEKFGSVEPLLGPAAEELRMHDALTGLARYSMILDATDTTFRVHGLVQTVEWVRAVDDGQDVTAQTKAVECLAATFPVGAYRDPIQWELGRQLMPHVNRILAATDGKWATAALGRALNRAGVFMFGQGLFREAERLIGAALFIREQVNGQEHPDTLNSMNDLALCKQHAGDATGALPLFRRALEGQERALGVEHPDALATATNLVACMLALGDAAGALPLSRRALEGYERVLGAEHPEALNALNNLARCMRALGDAAGALPVFHRALEGRERALGVEHLDTLSSVNNVASCLDELGEVTGAVPLLRRALEGRESVLGADHPDTLISANNLAACLYGLGDVAGAAPLLRRALESCDRVLGSEHPDTLAALNNLAQCMRALGDAAGALPLQRRALETCERVLGAEHPQTLSSLDNLASCLRALGDPAGALPLHRRALESGERVLGAEHPDTLTGVNNLALCLYMLGDAAGALPLYRRALESRERVLGPEHPDTFISAGALAGCLNVLGRLDEATPLHRRELDGLERNMGADHPRVLTACNNLAVSMRKGGRPDLALPFARRVANTSERVLARDSPLLLFRRNNLALTLLMTGEIEEAHRLLAANWAWPAPDCANTTPGIAFLALLADLLDGGNGADMTGRLKALLLGPKLPMAASVAHPWDVGYLLDYPAPRLPDGHHAFLAALVAAINDPDLAPALDRFPIWRDTEAVPRDTPWPVTPT
jgi:tetratricopeptide (TPR) repeat protein